MAVTADVPECSSLGLEIMEMGGNAMDAAIASAICVGTINSFSSGLGGGGFLMVKMPGSKIDVETVDFRETTPAQIETHFYKQDKDVSKKGGFAVAVPGEVKGLSYAHSKYGKLPWKILCQKNAEIAKEFVVSKQLERRLKKLEKHIRGDPGLFETYTKNGNLLKAGDIVRRENYAKTLESIGEDPENFYQGEIAESMVKCVNENNGVLTLQDLKDYKIKTPPPLKSTYKDSIIFTTNLPTAGPMMIEGLNILETFDLEEIQELGKKLDIFPEYYVLIEIFKFMSAKRSDLADNDYSPLSNKIVETLTSKETAKKISSLIDFQTQLTLPDYGYKNPFIEDYGTTHLNTVDKNGMMVLLTSTINLEFGAKFMDKKTGIIFNNEIDDFYIPSVKNAFDLPSSPANIIFPGKRPFSSACPLLMIRQKDIIAIGASGGTRIPTSILNAIFHLELGCSLKDAIAKPRLHHQIIPFVTYIEKTLDEPIQKYLKSKGNEVQVSSLNSIFTAVQGLRVSIDPKVGVLEAVSDKRKGGEAAVG